MRTKYTHVKALKSGKIPRDIVLECISSAAGRASRCLEQSNKYYNKGLPWYNDFGMWYVNREIFYREIFSQLATHARENQNKYNLQASGVDIKDLLSAQYVKRVLYGLNTNRCVIV